MILMSLRYAVPILWILVLEAIGGGIGIMTSANIDNWYADLNRSPLNPPGWVFGIVLIVKAWQQERVSTYLLAPYLAWISFATYLTLHVALFN